MRAHPLRPLDLANTPQAVLLRLTRGKPLAAALAGSALIFMATLVVYQWATPGPSQPVATFESAPAQPPIEASIQAEAPAEVAPPLATAIPTAAAVAAAPLAPAAPAPTPVLLDEGIATDVLQRYYAAINARDYQAAYALVTTKWRQRQSYPDFAAGYGGTRKDTLTVLGAGSANQAGTPGFVLTVDVTAETTTGRTQHFNGLYFVMLEGAQPKIDSGRLTPVTA